MLFLYSSLGGSALTTQGGLPREFYVLNPRKLHHEGDGLGTLRNELKNKKRRWFYNAASERIPILSDELIHFRDWNPVRGVNPLISLALELEQDYYANKANSQLLKNNTIPQGILKTEQTLRPEEADLLERRWESKYGRSGRGGKLRCWGRGRVLRLFLLRRKW
jgi:hypothetical protein